MTTTELHRAVARATRESVNTVRKLGFVLVVPQARKPRRSRRPLPSKSASAVQPRNGSD